MLLYLPLTSTPIPAFPLPQFFLASYFTFLLCRELRGVLTFPRWHLKCFLVQNILVIAIETGSLVWRKKEKKKKKKSGSLKLCNSVILPKPINGIMLGGRRKPAACWSLRRGHPFLGNLSQVLNPGLNQEKAGFVQKGSRFSLTGQLPAESGEVGQTCILLSVLHLKS